MYTRIRNVQILIALLKEHGVRHLVLSPGSRNIPFVHSVENDDYFKCYSVVDERSAAYFAIGISVETGEKVAISCTSSTATCNYLPAISEACYQGIPLLVLTGDKDPYLLNQMDPQHIDQVGMYDRFCRKSIDVPVVNSEHDAWYANRIINEGLLALTHKGSGPVHINYHILDHSSDIENYIHQLPLQRKIEYADFLSKHKSQELVKTLASKKRIIILAGQSCTKSKEFIELINTFFEKYNCIILTEHTSNINTKGTIQAFGIIENLSSLEAKELLPDIIITIGKNNVSYAHVKFGNYSGQFEHWAVREDGNIMDGFKNLSKVFECADIEFLRFFAENAPDKIMNDKNYYEMWKKRKEKILVEEIEFSNFYVAGELARMIPENSILHTGILNSTRHLMYYDLSPTIAVHSNIGTDGIDGSMSTFLGQAMVTNKKCFLLLGDLSFFYDMNSIGIRGIKNNVRILVVNNMAGAEFHFAMGLKKNPTLNIHTAASHDKSVKGYVESLDFVYLRASTKEEFDLLLTQFINSDFDKPVVMEVFTDADKDGEVGRTVMSNIQGNMNVQFKDKSKRKIKNMLGDNNISKIRNIIKK